MSITWNCFWKSNIEVIIVTEAQTQNEQNENSKSFVVSIGFFGGLITSFMAYVALLFNFVPFGPRVVWQMWPEQAQAIWMRGHVGNITGIILLSLLSIGAAYLYYLLLRKLESPWIGIMYGLAWWALIFLVINQVMPGVQTIAQLGWTTNIVFISLFVFYGLFVGYSISYEVLQREVNQQAS